jgi:hypothetical protein
MHPQADNCHCGHARTDLYSVDLAVGNFFSKLLQQAVAGLHSECFWNTEADRVLRGCLRDQRYRYLPVMQRCESSSRNARNAEHAIACDRDQCLAARSRERLHRKSPCGYLL